MQDSVFTMMLKGKIPREIIYQDDVCFVIPTNKPHQPGHSLVIPKVQVANWEDLDKATFLHCMEVVRIVGKALKKVYGCPKVGISTVGFEVEHVHIHVIPLYEIIDTEHARAKEADFSAIQAEARKIRAEIAKQDKST